MFERRAKIIHIIVFWLMIVIPLVLTNMQKGTISVAENRRLMDFPSIRDSEGELNRDFNIDFERWINDNIGLRAAMVVSNARIQYYLFDKLDESSNMVLGPNGEYNYATKDIIKSYQHFDLKDEEEKNLIASGYQYFSDYLSDRNIQLYYFQCWDKQSIYPEQFPTTIIQHGDISKTDQIVDIISTKTNIPVISPKDKLIESKPIYDVYCKWGDVTHWTQRGAYLGYIMLMDTINEYNGNKYKVLSEEDYNITVVDQGEDLFGGIHNEDYLENFEIKNPMAYHTDEAPKWLSRWADNSRLVYYNDKVENDDTLLIIGDSYFDTFLYDDLAESFSKVVLIHGDYTDDLYAIVDEYSPNIVVVENAERCDRSDELAVVALSDYFDRQ